MRRVFVCSPYSGDTERNTRLARELCLAAVRDEVAPFAPHLLYPQFLTDTVPSDREAGIDAGIAFLRTCSEVWVYDRLGVSRGMLREIAEAEAQSIPVVRMPRPFWDVLP